MVDSRQSFSRKKYQNDGPCLVLNYYCYYYSKTYYDEQDCQQQQVRQK
jgi:hypothetical protein